MVMTHLVVSKIQQETVGQLLGIAPLVVRLKHTLLVCTVNMRPSSRAIYLQLVCVCICCGVEFSDTRLSLFAIKDQCIPS